MLMSSITTNHSACIWGECPLHDIALSMSEHLNMKRSVTPMLRPWLKESCILQQGFQAEPDNHNHYLPCADRSRGWVFWVYCESSLTFVYLGYLGILSYFNVLCFHYTIFFCVSWCLLRLFGDPFRYGPKTSHRPRGAPGSTRVGLTL